MDGVAVGKLGWGRASESSGKAVAPPGSKPSSTLAQGKLPHLSSRSLSLPTNNTWTPSYQPLQAASIVGRDRGGGKTQP